MVALLGFGAIADALADIKQFLFFVFVALFVVMMIPRDARSPAG